MLDGKAVTASGSLPFMSSTPISLGRKRSRKASSKESDGSDSDKLDEPKKTKLEVKKKDATELGKTETQSEETAAAKSSGIASRLRPRRQPAVPSAQVVVSEKLSKNRATCSKRSMSAPILLAAYESLASTTPNVTWRHNSLMVAPMCR
ncbi:unnamed protein product [Gongylonema pulchrum]|uniref:Uncharacterized protein n=1 Tax=Gongylonema pulchrum TaxID=637853 RepID=A0A183E1V6_9BILA|nr:unnamed protein product [Gongylonema pulchrum]